MFLLALSLGPAACPEFEHTPPAIHLGLNNVRVDVTLRFGKEMRPCVECRDTTMKELRKLETLAGYSDAHAMHRTAGTSLFTLSITQSMMPKPRLVFAEQGIDARLREAETELTAARRLLREAGAERDLLRCRLEEARQETEDLLRGPVQASLRVFSRRTRL